MGCHMRRFRGLLFVMLFSACPTNAYALKGPSFSLDGCAWEASHIIVVTAGDKIDGAVEVLESWKGDLKKGDRLSIPELAEFAPQKMRGVSARWFDGDKK